jgi:hypothetical protein
MQFDPGCSRLSNVDLLHDFGFFHVGVPTRLISYAKTENNFTIDGAIRIAATQHLPGECVLRMCMIASSVLHQSIE